MAVHPQQKPGEVTRAFVIEALLGRPEGADVAVHVEDAERVVMLENGYPLGRFRSRRQDVVLVVYLDHVLHGPSRSRAAQSPPARAARRYPDTGRPSCRRRRTA